MKIKRILSALLLVMLIFTVVGCSAPSDTEGNNQSSQSTSEDIKINIVSASSGGAWYSIGGALAELFKTNISNSVTSVGPGGGISNIFSVSSNEAQLGFGFPDDVLDAEAGVGDFEGNKLTNVKGVTALYPGVLHIATAEGSDINSIEDLKGKVLCTQQKGNSAEKMIRKVLEVYDMSYDDLGKVNFVGFTDAVDLVKDGHADAIAYMSTYPYAAMQDLAESKGVKLLSLDDEHIEKLLEISPAYDKVVIPGGIYKGSDENVSAIGCKTILFANTETSEDVVYNMTKIMYENYDQLLTVNKSLEHMKPEYGCSTGIGLHPGAERYYKEIGVIK
ncbi:MULTISPECIES: TAXI family TRAP transporter solute-binding subunit [unclassified Sedimentibacter]|uniref:TAXI family TRAP transporter solute-binding subunit n=1 Tax=unclassified Sedimentibacter TaxID=2649220 RepID=UPI0027E04AED|nr:TAXI family TRAP transporter solute-binding subunit [Sedimentibacter sp. MB35-C1]WMJ76950.1 TAXI family TRAP transporter solute-binding subunit [Sedimentibacter sp. MB35-C1]